MGNMGWILAVDAGNSVTRVAAVKAGEILALGRLPTGGGDLEQGLGHMMDALRSRLGQAPQAVGISTVVPGQTPALESAAARAGAPVVWVGPEAAGGLAIDYQPPESLGSDRIANALAARRAYGAPCIAADLGTALTVDVVDAAGVFRGGLVFPGVDAAGGALGQTTAQVRPVSSAASPASVIGGSTQEGVANGLGYGYAALLEGLLRQIREELGAKAPAVLTGGGRRRLARLPAGLDHCDPHLTLRGVAAAAAWADSRISRQQEA